MISVIVPHFNQPDLLDRCLASLVPQAGGAEIIVVDNGSSVRPEPVVARYPSVRLLHEPAQGPGPARSFGARMAEGEVLAFIDADCVADPGWLAAIARAFSDPEAQVLGGEVLILHADADRPTAYEAYESEFGFRNDFYVMREHYSATANMAVRRDVMGRVGDFAGIEIAEDKDWGQRARALGIVIRWVPDMIVRHPARATFAELARKWDRLAGHAFAMQGQTWAGRLRWAVKAALMGFSAPAALPRILGSRRIGGGPGAKLGAFAVLARIRLYRAKLMMRLLLSGGAGEKASRWRDQG